MIKIFTNKLILFVALPIVVMSLLALLSVKERLQHDAMEQLKAHMLELVQHYAASVNSELDKSSSITNTTALLLATSPIKNKKIHYKILEENIKQNSVIFGSAIAYEKGYFGNGELFGPYAYRFKHTFKHLELAQDSYDYTDKEHFWYLAAKNQRASVWSEPYLDDGASNILMITYSAPILKEDKFVGVVTVDLDLAKLNETLNLGGLDGSDYIILTNSGHFAYHTNKDLIGKSFINIADDLGFDRSIYIARKMITGEKGYVELSNKEGEIEMVFFAPIGKYGWSFALTLKKKSAQTIAYDNSSTSQIWMLGILILALFSAILVEYFSYNRPYRNLRLALKQIKNNKKVIFSKKDYPKDLGLIVKNMLEIFDHDKELIEESIHEVDNLSGSLNEKNKLLQQADKRVMGILSSAVNSVVIINSMGEILATNYKSESILKLKVKNMVGESILSFIDEKDKEYFSSILEELFATSTDKTIEKLTIISRNKIKHDVKAIFKPVYINEVEIEANIVFVKVES